MAHFLGLEHSVSGVLGQIAGLAGPASPLQYFAPPTQTFAPTTGPVAPALPPPTGVSTMQTGCKPKAYEIVTTVHADGTTTTKQRCKTRKRRRRLATTSDIRDLAALKSILGGGKVFEAWIATRGR